MRYQNALLLFLACGFTLTPARAEPDPLALIEKRFRKLDLDGDGKLSTEEAKPMALWIGGADANKDGFMTLEEIGAHLKAQIAQVMEARSGSSAGQSPTVDAQPPPMLLPATSPREEPRKIKAGDARIGLRIPDATLQDLEGKPHQLSEMLGEKPTVIALVSTSCPVSKRNLPALARLAKSYAERGVAFLLIAPTPTDTAPELQAALNAAGMTTPCWRDPEQSLLATLGARATTDTFLIDAARTLVYRGAIDDQYGLGYSLEAPRKSYLADALEATLAGRPPHTPATEAPGCALDLEKASPLKTELTYHGRISRVIQQNCQSCHRTGGVAPFPLETFEQVTAKSGMIRKMVERGLMPPWFAAPPAAGEHSPWGNDRSLAALDRADLLAWLSAGKPAGNPKDAPQPVAFPPEWMIGKPDVVLQLPAPIDIKAEGVMSYKNVTVETGFTEAKWIRGFEVSPTAREVVHHVLIFAQEGNVSGSGRPRFEGEQDERGGFFAAYVPGNSHAVFPEGFAKPLAAGARLRFQIHYTPNGTATQDQMKLALLFADAPPKHIIRVAGIAGHRLNIPAGAAHHPESAVLPVPKEVKLLGFTPHMHLRGSAFRYEAVLPDGTLRTLLDIPRYDFNWQLSYRYANPLTLPAGSQIRATGWFDNSTGNPANPDPTKIVRWGPQTYDEMMLGYVEYYVPEETAPSKTAAR